MSRQTYCKRCDYIFQFYKRVHHMEYCNCEACGVDYLYTKDDGGVIFRYIGEDFGYREVSE